MTTLNLWGEPAYYTTLEGSLAIMQEIHRMRAEENHLEWFRSHAHLVRKELERLGVKFPKRFTSRRASLLKIPKTKEGRKA